MAQAAVEAAKLSVKDSVDTRAGLPVAFSSSILTLSFQSFRSIIGLPRCDLPTLLNPCRRYMATSACEEIALSEGRASSRAELNPRRRAALTAASIRLAATPRRRCS